MKQLPSKRECGGCTMCCKLLGISELDKPRDVWCQHCNIGQGCSIYGSHPKSCQEFRCLWIDGFGVEELKPDRCKTVFMLSPLDPKQVQVNIDANHEWRGTRVDRAINFYIEQGFNVALVQGSFRRLLVGKGRLPPEGIVDIGTGEILDRASIISP